MARINLLPWRAERRKQRQREFMTMLGFAAIAGVVLSALIWFYYDRQISGQGDRNAFLTAEIARVKEQNKEIDRLDRQKDRLLARKKVIEQLQAKRSQMVHLFDALVRTNRRRSCRSWARVDWRSRSTGIRSAPSSTATLTTEAWKAAPSPTPGSAPTCATWKVRVG